jgi:hypothetical protein
VGRCAQRPAVSEASGDLTTIAHEAANWRLVGRSARYSGQVAAIDRISTSPIADTIQIRRVCGVGVDRLGRVTALLRGF